MATHDSTERAPAERRRPAAGGATAFLFVVLECQNPLAGGMRVSLHGLEELVIGRGKERRVERRTEGNRGAAVLHLVDRQMSAKHVRIVRDACAWHVEDCGSTNGTRLRGERVTRAPLRDGDLLELGQTVLAYREFDDPSVKRAGDRDAAEQRELEPGLATLDPTLAIPIARLGRIAMSPVSVLLLGESGTGKELLARAVHQLSMRPGPLIAVNCGAIPEALMESQMFGHVKGAFSGALRDEAGFVRAADHGTLFFDEIGDLASASQAALLRVLQEGEVCPVGTTRPVKVDIRVVCATHRPLEELARGGAFRRDLYARLAGFSHLLPPLRERSVDLGLMIATLLAEPNVREPSKIRFSPAAARALMRYDWPLNVRELKQCLTASSALADDGIIDLAELPPVIADAADAPWEEDGAPASDEELRRELVTRLANAHGNVSEAARAMGKARQQVQRWVRRLHINPEAFRTAD